MNRAPFLLSPAGKDYLWGGSRLKTDYNKNISLSPLAETWECSTHPEGLSVVASGEYAGSTLRDVLRNQPELLGSRHSAAGDLPILIKLIDARLDLSVQVHPDNEYAYLHENGAYGKNELWYVVDASPEAMLISGFHRNVTREQLRSSALDGTIEKILHRVPIRSDDVFYIKAGTVHAIGAGSLIAEVTENSNLTYRLYDYNRVDRNGKKRPLHLDKAIAVADRTASGAPRQPMRTLRFQPGSASELLCVCHRFRASRLLLNTERVRSLATVSTTDESFGVLLCYRGCGAIRFDDPLSTMLPFFQGDCVFLPAGCNASLHGNAKFLRVDC